MTRADEFMEKSNKDKKYGFGEWMKNPMTKAIISTIPPSENLEVLLQACFESGFGCGIGSVTSDLVAAMIKPRVKD